MERLFPVDRGLDVVTPYGRAKLFPSQTSGRRFYLLPRHGIAHEVPPHRVNFLANLSALKQVGVEVVIATGAVGVMSEKLGVGELGLLAQFIDMSKRHLTFFEDKVFHADMSEPYDASLQRKALAAGSRAGVKVASGLTYVSVDGPRYETPAEIRMFRLIGGDVVGMTGAHEAALSGEIGLRYCSIVVGTNFAAGFQERISHSEVSMMMRKKAPVLRRLLRALLEEL